MILNGSQKVLNAFESGIFPKGKQEEGLTSILGSIAKVSDYSNLQILVLNKCFKDYQ